MDYGLRGKTVLVTAASKGLGFATANGFAAEGAKVMLASRSEVNLDEAVKRIKQSTGNQDVSYFVTDVTNPEHIDALFKETESKFGTVDVLINNAGGPPAGDFMKFDDAAWQKAFELSLMSVVRVTRRAVPAMQQKKWGRILNFTSSSMKQPLDNLMLSNTFRTAVAGLSKSLALELAKDQILVNAMGAGRVHTERIDQLDSIRAEATGLSIEQVRKESEASIPLGRYGSPEEFANLAVFLGSGANGYITGQSILVDGGLVRAL